MMTRYVGVDPGQSGAIAVMTDRCELLRVSDLPVIRDGKLSWIDGAAMQAFLIDAAEGCPMRAFVERVQAMPKQGISSSFNFGVGFGSLLGILQARRVAIEFVTPARWKSQMGLKDVKQASLDKARLMYPNADLALARHEGRAEAILLARWGIKFGIKLGG